FPSFFVARTSARASARALRFAAQPSTRREYREPMTELSSDDGYPTTSMSMNDPVPSTAQPVGVGAASAMVGSVLRMLGSSTSVSSYRADEMTPMTSVGTCQATSLR